MEKDFSPDKQSPKDIIEPTKSNEDAAMIHPSHQHSRSSRAAASSSNNDTSSPAGTVGTAIASRTVDTNHFPTHLYNMLTEIDNGEGAAAATVEGRTFASIVSWQPHGKCFLIHDEDMFSKYVLPKYFCRLKFTSFQRQLHFHGFKRLCKQGPDKGAYYHDLFVRGMPEVCTYIQRIKSSKGLRGRKRKSQDKEPDFYKQTSSPSIRDVIAKATSAASGVPAPEPPKLSLPTNETPLVSHLSDVTDMVRLEPTPIAQMRTVQSGQLDLPVYADFPQGVHPQAPSPKRQRQDPPRRNPSMEESKLNSRADMAVNSRADMAAVQQILQQGGDGSLRDARSGLQNLSDGSGAFMSNASSVMPQMNTGSVRSDDDDLWQLGTFCMERGGISASMGQQQMPSLGTYMSHHDLEIEPAPLQFPQEPSQLQGHQMDQQRQQQQQSEAEDQMQQHILRQIEEQQRQLRQQRQNILQGQQLQLQQRQMDAMFQERLDPFAMQLQQQQPLNMQHSLGLGLGDQPFPFQQPQQQQQQDERLARLREQEDPQIDPPQDHMQRFPKQG